MKRVLRLYLLSAGLLSAGCRFDAHSPTFDIVGSYFPAWMVCIILGLAASLITRQLLILYRIDLYLRFAPLVYTCMLLFYTLAIWLLFFQN